MKLSARNQIKGKVTQVIKGQTTGHVHIDIGNGTTMHCSITNEAIDDLALAVGRRRLGGDQGVRRDGGEIIARTLLATLLLLASIGIARAQDAGITVSGPAPEVKLDLAALPQIDVPVGFTDGRTPGGKQMFIGPLLWTVLGHVHAAETDKQPTAVHDTLLVTGSDGYVASLAMGEMAPGFEDKKIILALSQNGEKLTQGHLRLVMPGDGKRRPQRARRGPHHHRRTRCQALSQSGQAMNDPGAVRPGELVLHDPPPADDAGLVFIGRIHTPWHRRGETPRRGSPDGPDCRLEIFPPWVPALAGLAEHPHVDVIYWLHLSRRDLLLQSPRHDGTTRGTFSLRSPVRPNPIGISLAVLVSVEGPIVTVRGLDCLDGTPLIDLKPGRCGFA